MKCYDESVVRRRERRERGGEVYDEGMEEE